MTDFGTLRYDTVAMKHEKAEKGCNNLTESIQGLVQFRTNLVYVN